MKEDKAFEKWFRKNFYFRGKPMLFIPIYRNSLDFKNDCKLAWEEASKRAENKQSILVNRRTALTDVRYRLERIKTLALLVERPKITEKQKTALQRIREVANDLVDDMKRGNIEVEWSRNALKRRANEG